MTPQELTARFQRLVDEHYEAVWSWADFCARGDPDAAEDVVNEAFLAAFERLAKGREFTGDPGQWLRAVVRNQLRARYRRGKRQLPVEQEALDRLTEVEDRPLARLVRDEAGEALQGCLERLPEAEQDLLARRYRGGRKPGELAAAEEANAKTLRVRLFRIRRKLKDCLESKLGDWCEL